ncbi:MFS transporter [Saccharothrix obliqua]|uniref:MFS transporter n=1 Tax=Saccharothrix obliqua TaxID=2861747 RepID=UPI001C5F9F6A|nr:MFS transporter [Saccharothrix obliqua]MBW4721862.1 MFS transporter [Saccharothrix obliqua]
MPSTPAPAAGPMAGRREWIGLAVLCLPTLLASVDLTVLYLALPRLSAELGTSATQQLWIVDIFGFMTSGLLVTMGTLGDRIGNRKMLIIGCTAFAAASLLAAYSPNPETLIAARALLGVAGAVALPATLALITFMFKNPVQRGMAIATWMSTFMVGLMIGPLIGGVLLEFFWWGSAFLLAVPVMVLVVVLAVVLLPERKDPNAGKLDWTSVALSLLAMIPLVFGFKELAKQGFAVAPLVALLVGVVFSVVFVRRQRQLDNPLLDLKLFSINTLRTALVLGIMVGALNSGVSLLVTQFFQVIAGLSPMEAGLWLLPPSVAMVIGLFLAPPLAAKLRPGGVIALGLGISTVGYVILSQVEAAGGLALVVTGFGVLLFGMGLPSSLGTALVMGAAPPDRTGAASSLQQTGNEFGIAIGIATLGSLGMAVYRGQLSENMPSSVPADAADTAQHGIPGALETAERFPEVLEPARAAFTSGLNVVSLVSAVLMVGLAVFAYFSLRNVEAAPMGPPDGMGEGGPAGGYPLTESAAAEGPAPEGLPDGSASAEDVPVPRAEQRRGGSE